MTWTQIDYDDEKTLPPETERVLLVLVFDDDRRCVSEGWRVEGREDMWQIPDTDAYNDYIEYFGNEVSHWQPLPELPEIRGRLMTEQEQSELIQALSHAQAEVANLRETMHYLKGVLKWGTCVEAKEAREIVDKTLGQPLRMSTKEWFEARDRLLTSGDSNDG